MSISNSDLALTNSLASNQVAKTAGTVIPNRIFVGGIAPETTDIQLKEFFASYGAVKDTKIICDRAGASKGYGFVTFETQEDADKIINKESPSNLIFKERKLNIGPAVRKQQLYPRLLDSLPSGSGTAAMFLTSAGAYSYATPGGLAMMTGDGYQQALQQQQQIQPQMAAANYSNMIIPAQIPSLYMPQPSYPYSPTSAMQNPVAAQAIPYANNPATNAQWIPNPRCLQTPAVTCTTPSPIYPDSLMYATANSAGQAVPAQYLDVSEGTMHENNNNDESRCSSAQTSADALLNSCHAVTSVMSVQQQGRPVHQPYHFHGNTSPQPPPIKKMASMPSHYPSGEAAVRCFSAPFVTGNMKPALLPANVCSGNRGASLALLAGHHDMRVKFEHDRLTNNIANIAPPTPPATPAGSGNN